MNELWPRRRETARERFARIRRERSPGPFLDGERFARFVAPYPDPPRVYVPDDHPAPPNWLDSFKHTLKWMLPL